MIMSASEKQRLLEANPCSPFPGMLPLADCSLPPAVSTARVAGGVFVWVGLFGCSASQQERAKVPDPELESLRYFSVQTQSYTWGLRIKVARGAPVQAH